MVQIFELFGKGASMKIIEFFLDNPTAEFYEKQVKEKARLSKGSVNLYLKKLEKSGFLIKSRKGQMSIYRLNSSNLIVKQLKILKNVDRLHSSLKGFTGVQVFLFGSCARGENTEKSDIDILVIGKNRDDIAKIKKFDDKIKISFYTPIEWSLLYRKDKAFFGAVERDKIRLV